MATPSSEHIQRELAATEATLPIYNKIRGLFTDPKLFDSFDRLQSAGFKLIDRSEDKLLAGSHKQMQGYLFKKYRNDISGSEQLRNYMRRIEGAKLVRRLITKAGFSRVQAPRKWLHELPSSFPARYMLIVEKLDLVSRSDAEEAYDAIDKKQLRELATVLYYFRGLNSTIANLPYTEDGKIAFIDTERWPSDRVFLKHVGDRLPSKRRKQAEDLFKELKKAGEKPFTSSF